MSKFLPVGTKGEMLNTDMIARIIPMEDDGCVVITKDGQHFHSEFDLHEEVDDFDTIRAVIPCTDISAIFLDKNGDTDVRPCPFVLLMSNGKLEPFMFVTDADLEFLASEGQTGFVGFVPSK